MRIDGLLQNLAFSFFEMSSRCTLKKGLDGPQSQYSCYIGEKVSPPAGNRSPVSLLSNMQCGQYTDEQSRLRVLVNLPEFPTLNKLCTVKCNDSCWMLKKVAVACFMYYFGTCL